MIYEHAPWENDPFDTVYSFSMFFVPLIAAVSLTQVILCRKSEPLPLSRARSLVRTNIVSVGTMAAAVAADWVAVATGANLTGWRLGTTGALITGLAISTALTAGATVEVIRIGRRLRLSHSEADSGPDWLADALIATRTCFNRMGPLRSLGTPMIDRLERTLAPFVREHPLWSAAAASLIFGVGVGANQSIREGYSVRLGALVILLLAAGVYGFIVPVAGYLSLVRSKKRLAGSRRRMLDSVVAGCIGMVGALAFRDLLWQAVGVHASHAGPGSLVMLISAGGAAAFLLTLTGERLAGVH